MATSKKRSGGASLATASAKMRISKRIVNTKRHTQGYMIGSRFVSTNEARRLATQGRISGVRVVGGHIQSVNGSKRRLSDLPTEVRRSN